MDKIIISALYLYKQELIKSIHKSEKEIEKIKQNKDTFTSNAKITSRNAKTQNKMNVLFDSIKRSDEIISKIDEYILNK